MRRFSSNRTIETTVSLDSTDTDIIECSIVGENRYDLTKTRKCSYDSPSVIHTPKTPIPTRESRNSLLGSRNALRSSLRKNFGLDDPELLVTPRPRKNSGGSNIRINKLISTLKKTPEGPHLSKSKLRNVEQWLRENSVEKVNTPPFANLSVTPVKSYEKRFPPATTRGKKKKPSNDESSIDSEVEGVLRAVYGNDWRVTRARTEPKKKTKFTPGTSTKKKKGARRNILGGRKLDLSDEENLNDSVMSGVRVIDLDSSAEAKSVRKKRRKSLETYLAPVEKKNPETPGKEVKTPKKTFLASLSVSTPTSKCHPDAQYYKVNFKAKKEQLVSKLYKLYNGEVFGGKLDENMNFSWNVKLRGTAGFCYNKRITKSSGDVIRLSRIEFSTKIVDRADRLRDTMIHELCHAASWVIDGVLDGHGGVWAKWAQAAMKRFPELPPIKRCHNYDIVSKYVYRCTGCGYSIKRHSKSINTERKRCGHCYGVLELLINKKKKGKGEVPEFDTTRTLPTPNKFAMFVKENYHLVKSTKSNAKHSEIMKALSEQYALMKNCRK